MYQMASMLDRDRRITVVFMPLIKLRDQQASRARELRLKVVVLKSGGTKQALDDVIANKTPCNLIFLTPEMLASPPEHPRPHADGATTHIYAAMCKI